MREGSRNRSRLAGLVVRRSPWEPRDPRFDCRSYRSSQGSGFSSGTLVAWGDDWCNG